MLRGTAATERLKQSNGFQARGGGVGGNGAAMASCLAAGGWSGPPASTMAMTAAAGHGMPAHTGHCDG